MEIGIEVVLAALFGLLIGSFLNVCIYRWPRDLSVVRPRSFCPSCLARVLEGHGVDPGILETEEGLPATELAKWSRDAGVAWYDNIPVVSYLLLGGRCRKCGVPIGWRYPAVELLTAACFAWFVWHFGLTLITLKYCVLCALLIGLLFSDLETRLLPDEMTVGGFFIGLAFSLAVPAPGEIFRALLGIFGIAMSQRAGSLAEAAFGGLFPAFSIWFAGWVFERVRGKEGLGFGDVKMIAMVGAFLGVQGALMTLILGSLAGSVIGLAYIKLTGKDAGTYQLPFGTFLGAAALVSAVAGSSLLGLYVRALPQ